MIFKALIHLQDKKKGTTKEFETRIWISKTLALQVVPNPEKADQCVVVTAQGPIIALKSFDEVVKKIDA